MIRLYQIHGAWGVSSVSPFCVKLGAYLRMTGRAYETAPGDPRRAPAGKVPWIEIDGETIADSQRIVDELERRGPSLDARLDAGQRAQGRALRRMLEEGTYWALVHARWFEDDGFQGYAPVFESVLPPVVGPLILRVIRSRMKAQAWQQGQVRMGRDAVYEAGIADFAAASEALGEGPFLFGDRPTTFDATLYAWVASAGAFPVASPIREAVRADARLQAHRARVEEEWGSGA